tara:strand:- start:52 stop:507 length:456 start_codon:yes stop_codon:yes gene_type:complete
MNIYYEFQINYEDDEYHINEHDICINSSCIKLALLKFFKLCEDNNMPNCILQNLKKYPQKYLTIIFADELNEIASEETDDFLAKKISFLFDDYNLQIIKKNCPKAPDAFTTAVKNPNLYKQQCEQYAKDLEIWKNETNIFKKKVGMINGSL